jgi:hypothetical protein
MEGSSMSRSRNASSVTVIVDATSSTVSREQASRSGTCVLTCVTVRSSSINIIE